MTCAFYQNSFVIELDEKFYDRERLPGRVARGRAYWGIVGEVWKWKAGATAGTITPNPVDDTRDESGYDPLRPGIH